MGLDDKMGDKNMKQIFYRHIDKYHPVNWMLKCVELERTRENFIHTSQLYINSSSEFLQILADIAIRRSQNSTIKGRLPTDKEFLDFISLYINTQGQCQAELIEKYSLAGLSLITYEQIKFKYPEPHLVARSFIVYTNYDPDIKQMTGLTLFEIIQIYVALVALSLYSNSKVYVFKIENISIPEHPVLNRAKLTPFLDFFSMTIKEYRSELRDLGLDKHQLYSFRLLELYPIIRFDNEMYIIPIFRTFLQTVTTGIYFHLLNYFGEDSSSKAKAYLDNMGDIFEDYVRVLTSQVFDNMIEAKDIVGDGNHAEFAIEVDDTVIVVEVKKATFKRDTAFKSNFDDIDKMIDNHLLKAYKQIENTFNYIEKNKIGIIVTFGDINVPSGIKEYMRKKYPNSGVAFHDDIIMMSIGSYEMLLSNTAEQIAEILKRYLKNDEVHRGDIIQNIEISEYKLNPFLEEIYHEKLPEYEEGK